MKKRLIYVLIGAIVCMLSACGQRENIEHTQANISNNVTSTEGVPDDVEKEIQSSYRFLADSSNIESISNNRVYIKYPEQVFQDDTVIFCYYILEYGEDEMSVYYRQSEQADEQLLYHATKKK